MATTKPEGVLNDAAQDNTSGGIPNGHSQNSAQVRTASESGIPGVGNVGNQPSGNNRELPNVDAGDGLYAEAQYDTALYAHNEEVNSGVEDPPTVPILPDPEPEPEPEPEPGPEPPEKTPEELLAEITEEARQLAIIDRNIERRKAQLQQQKNLLTSMYCPFKPGDFIKVKKSRFNMCMVIGVLSPMGDPSLHPYGEKSFSLSCQGVKNDGTPSNVIYTVHDYQIAETIVFVDPEPPVTPPEPIIPSKSLLEALLGLTIGTTHETVAYILTQDVFNETALTQCLEQHITIVSDNDEYELFTMPIPDALTCLSSNCDDDIIENVINNDLSANYPAGFTADHVSFNMNKEE